MKRRYSRLEIITRRKYRNRFYVNDWSGEVYGYFAVRWIQRIMEVRVPVPVDTHAYLFGHWCDYEDGDPAGWSGWDVGYPTDYQVRLLTEGA